MNLFSHLKFAALSDVGKKRKNNEDAFGTFPEAGLFCVADGMGGGDDGEIASAAVVRAVEETVSALKPSGVGGFAARDVGALLAAKLSRASAWICHRAHERRLNGCGSTFVGVVFDATSPNEALAVHAGDSRLYLLRGRSITQITRDHSVAELMGEKDESKVNPMFRSMVVNGIGIRSKAEPEFTPFKVESGDRVLVCSDGLSRMVPDRKILSLSRGETDPGKAVRAMIGAALEAGGIDNVTAVLVEIGTLPPPVLRLEVPPVAEDESEMETADERTTGGATIDSTGETMVCPAAPPGIAEEAPFGAEAPADGLFADGVAPVGESETAGTEQLEKSTETADGGARPTASVRRGRRVAILAIGLTVLVAAVVGVIAVCDEESCGSGNPTAPVKVDLSGSSAVETPCPPEPPPEPVPVPVSPTNEVPVTASPAPDVVTNAAPAAAPSELRSEIDTVLAEFQEVCRDKSIHAFVRAFRLLRDRSESKSDFREEALRFWRSARQLARARDAQTAETVTVDMRVLLQNAEPVRSALMARRAEKPVDEVVSAWEDVLSGDPVQASSWRACIRLIKTLPEVRTR